MTDPGDDGDGPRPMGWWEMLIEDMDAHAADYEEDGWDTLRLHPGDVTALGGEYGDQVGLDVLVPDDEFAELESALEDGGIDGYEVYRSTVDGSVALLLVLEDRERERAVFVPAYYSLGDDDVDRLFEQARATGELELFVRELSGTQVALSLADPDLLAPPEDGESGGPDDSESRS